MPGLVVQEPIVQTPLQEAEQPIEQEQSAHCSYICAFAKY